MYRLYEVLFYYKNYVITVKAWIQYIIRAFAYPTYALPNVTPDKRGSSVSAFLQSPSRRGANCAKGPFFISSPRRKNHSRTRNVACPIACERARSFVTV